MGERKETTCLLCYTNQLVVMIIFCSSIKVAQYYPVRSIISFSGIVFLIVTLIWGWENTYVIMKLRSGAMVCINVLWRK